MNMDPNTVRLLFKYVNKLMLLNWRLGLGPWLSLWPQGTGQYIVITHTGRNSGRKYRQPVNYAEIDGDLYCVAGYGCKSDWYQNIMANPSVEVWTPNGWWVGTAEEVTGEDRTIEKMRQVLRCSGFAALMAGIDTDKIPDEDLAENTKDYCMLRIHRAAARTGKGGPGDLVWIWPVMTTLLVLGRCGKKKKCK